MGERDSKRGARAVWRSLEGCDCPNAFSDGKPVPRDMRCTVSAIRCNARLAVVHAKLEAMGLDLQGKALARGTKTANRGGE